MKFTKNIPTMSAANSAVPNVTITYLGVVIALTASTLNRIKQNKLLC